MYLLKENNIYTFVFLISMSKPRRCIYVCEKMSSNMNRLIWTFVMLIQLCNVHAYLSSLWSYMRSSEKFTWNDSMTEMVLCYDRYLLINHFWLAILHHFEWMSSKISNNTLIFPYVFHFFCSSIKVSLRSFFSVKLF